MSVQKKKIFKVTAAAALIFLGPIAGCSASERLDKIVGVVKGSACSTKEWQGRGVAPLSFIEGIAATYAKVYGELRRAQGRSTAIEASAEIAPDNKQDALAVYGVTGDDAYARLRETYTLAIGHGLLESSGNPTVGADCVEFETSTYRHCSYYSSHPSEAEAGLFQPSFDSFGAARSTFAALSLEYKTPGADCMQTLFQGGLPDKKKKSFGTGEPLEFQVQTKACPAFATEYESVMLRVDARHFGPILRKEAKYDSDCESMLKSVEKVVDSS